MFFFVISIFVSAFLLFQVQPMIGKLLLPWFGGTPAVWSTTMLFFQVLLTGGYAYAYWLVGRVRTRNQGKIHLMILAVSLAVLLGLAFAWPSPVTPGVNWKPTTADFPFVNIFRLLAVSVGIPYFLLATNSTLMQAWFSSAAPILESPYMPYMRCPTLVRCWR